MIYTSYYGGKHIGEPISISLYPPRNWKGKHLPLFAPTAEILNSWKQSAKDSDAEVEYTNKFREKLESQKHLIKLWVDKQSNVLDITLCCYEEYPAFCHRHQVGSEVIATYLAELWGGEVGTQNQVKPSLIAQVVNHNPDIQIIHSAIYDPQILQLIDKCNAEGYPVNCNRLQCGYYRVSLHWPERCDLLGDWSEMGLLSVLSGLLNSFDRARLAPWLEQVSQISEVEPQVGLKPQVAHQEQVIPQASLITYFPRIEASILAEIQNWCNSIKKLMFPSASQYANGRLELHLRHFVSLASAKSANKTEVKAIKPGFYPGSEMIEEFGESLLPDFHQALVLFYPEGTQIKVHRDSPAYAIGGAAQINVSGYAKFSISGNQNVRQMESYLLQDGDCISFDNKQPHGIDRVASDRWAICFFKLKSEYLVQENSQQLSLLA